MFKQQNSHQNPQIKGRWKDLTITDNEIAQAKKSVFREIKQW